MKVFVDCDAEFCSAFSECRYGVAYFLTIIDPVCAVRCCCALACPFSCQVSIQWEVELVELVAEMFSISDPLVCGFRSYHSPGRGYKFNHDGVINTFPVSGESDSVLIDRNSQGNRYTLTSRQFTDGISNQGPVDSSCKRFDEKLAKDQVVACDPVCPTCFIGEVREFGLVNPRTVPN